MQIRLHRIIPENIEQEKIQQSNIWDHDITIHKGEHLHIVAPSGSGKTSLIHFIYGLRNDYSGSVFYDDQMIKQISAEEFSSFRQSHISIIFQDLRLFQDRTVRENIEIKRILKPYHNPEMIDEMAMKLGIANKLDQIVKKCSYGEQQRIAIIRSLMQPFEFLLLDEPYSHLDEENRQKAMELIYEECMKRNAAMVFADLKPLEFFKEEKIIYL